MDWARAKSILIITFILLNVFLLYGIVTYSIGQGVSGDITENAVQILAKRGVILEGEIPLHSNDMPTLECEGINYNIEKAVQVLFGSDLSKGINSDSFDGLELDGKSLHLENEGTLVYSDSNPSDIVDISSVEKAEKYLRKLISSIGIKESSFVLDQYLPDNSGGYCFVFTEKYDKFMVFDNQIKGKLTSKGLTGFWARNRRIKGLAGDKSPIMAAYQVLLKNYLDGSNAIIKDITLGYMSFAVIDDGATQLSEGPVWRIKAGNKNGDDYTTEYFSARDGAKVNLSEYINCEKDFTRK